MQNHGFSLEDHGLEVRLARLAREQVTALEAALDRLSGSRKAESGRFPLFLLPLAENGLTAEQMIRLAERIPGDFPLDHREIYFDFRLSRWIRHIEPPTIAQCLDEYLINAESRDAGMEYLRAQWQDFLRRSAGE